MTDLFGSQDIVSYEKQSDLGDRDTSMDANANFERRPTTSEAVPLSSLPEGAWRAWSVLLGVYVFFFGLPMVSNYRITNFSDGSPNFALMGTFSCSSLWAVL